MTQNDFNEKLLYVLGKITDTLVIGFPNKDFAIKDIREELEHLRLFKPECIGDKE